MRFRASIHNISSLTKLTASLSSLNHQAWLRLNDQDVRFTVVPDNNGTQVWAVLQIDTIFETYTIQSAADNNAINLEVPLANLHRALKSAANASAASIRLTKKNNVPLLSLTITTSVVANLPPGQPSGNASEQNPYVPDFAPGAGGMDEFGMPDDNLEFNFDRPGRETVITQDIPIRVMAPSSVLGFHEPRAREPDVHIVLPPLLQLKSISDRFTKLALSSTKSASGLQPGFRGSSNRAPKLELCANMHGCLKLRLKTDAMNIASTWTGLTNPELDPDQVVGGEKGIAAHPSTRMRALGDPEGQSDEGWAVVRVDGKDWGRVLGIGRMGGRVIACFCHENALILYVYLPNDQDGGDESVLTYYVSSYSA